MLIPFRLSAMSDEQLMQRAAQGSDRAFEELYNRHARRLKGFFVRRLGNDADLAADFMHDTFLRLYSARETYREGRGFRPWLYTIAYNLIKNHFRNQLAIVREEEARPGARRFSDEKVRPGASRFSDEKADDTDIELEMDTATFRDALHKALKILPEPYAMLFSLHYEEELTVPQIAQITELPEGTVKSRLHKAMNFIKKELKQYENR